MKTTTIKWKLIRMSREDQRVWQHPTTQHLYLADHSGDGRGDDPGNPQSTDDGPLRIIHDEDIVLEPSAYGPYLSTSVKVWCERHNEASRVIIEEPLAGWLAKRLGLRLILKSKHYQYTRITPLTTAAPSLLDILTRIFRAHDSNNNGSVNGEAKLCPMFAELAREAIAKATP
jgi:hypothetical protein